MFGRIQFIIIGAVLLFSVLSGLYYTWRKGIEREALLEDSSQLATLFDNLMRVRKVRVTSGITRGQADLIESPAKVKRWQDAKRAKSEHFMLPCRGHRF